MPTSGWCGGGAEAAQIRADMTPFSKPLRLFLDSKCKNRTSVTFPDAVRSVCVLLDTRPSHTPNLQALWKDEQAARRPAKGSWPHH